MQANRNYIAFALTCIGATFIATACGGGDSENTTTDTAERLSTTFVAEVAPDSGPVLTINPKNVGKAIDCAKDGSAANATTGAKLPVDLKSTRREWQYADAAQRVGLIDALTQQLADESAGGSENADTKRRAIDAFVLANASTERDSIVALRLLPHLATLERHEGEPVLFGYLANRSLSLEARAAAAEILMDAGWRTSETLMQWLAEQSVPEGDIVALLDELKQTGMKN